MEIKIYKIRDKDGNFSSGSAYPRWTKRGKIWGSLGAVRRHLNMFTGTCTFNRTWYNKIPEDWVVLEITNDNVKEFKAKEFYPE